MIISTTHIEHSNLPRTGCSAKLRRDMRRAFTMVEILIGLSLGTIVLSGVFSAFLLLGRSGMNAVHYSASEAELRRGLEEFSQDVRMAKAIKWHTSTTITLSVPDNYAATGNLVTYAWDSSTTGDTAQCFYRMPGSATSSEPKTVFVRGVSAFSFSRFNRRNLAASTDAETKRVQITMNVRKTRSTLVAANTTLVSASFTLRNKVAN